MVKKKYSKTQINITLDDKLLKEVDRIKSYPKWRDNRSAVIEAAIEEFVRKPKNGQE